LTKLIALGIPPSRLKMSFCSGNIAAEAHGDQAALFAASREWPAFVL
jgi:hypothetical protein